MTFDGSHPLREDNLRWKTTMRTTSKTKRTCSLLEGTQRWTYSALRYFWGSLHFLCCLHILYNLHFWVGIILRLFNLFGFLGHFHIWGQTEGFWAEKKWGKIFPICAFRSSLASLYDVWQRCQFEVNRRTDRDLNIMTIATLHAAVVKMEQRTLKTTKHYK